MYFRNMQEKYSKLANNITLTVRYTDLIIHIILLFFFSLSLRFWNSRKWNDFHQYRSNLSRFKWNRHKIFGIKIHSMENIDEAMMEIGFHVSMMMMITIKLR